MDILNNIRKFVCTNKRIILTSVAAAGTIATAVVASQNTIQAIERRDQYRFEHRDDEEIDKFEEFKMVAPCYIPTILMAGATVATIIGAHNASNAKIAAYSSAYSMAQEAAHMYKEKVREVVDEKQLNEIDKKVAEEKQQTVTDPSHILIGDGKVMCIDNFSGRPFASTMELIRKAQNDANYILINDMYLSLNEFYNKLGLDPIGAGDELGWNVDHKIDLGFSSVLTEEGKPCLLIEFKNEPIANYSKLIM